MIDVICSWISIEPVHRALLTQINGENRRTIEKGAKRLETER